MRKRKISITCSECAHVLGNMSLTLQQWACPECGIEHDRDVNAAKNRLLLSGSPFQGAKRLAPIPLYGVPCIRGATALPVASFAAKVCTDIATAVFGGKVTRVSALQKVNYDSVLNKNQGRKMVHPCALSE